MSRGAWTSTPKTGTRFFFVSTMRVEDDPSLTTDLLDLRRRLDRRGFELPDGFHATDDRQAVRDEVLHLLKRRDIRVDVPITRKPKSMTGSRPTSITSTSGHGSTTSATCCRASFPPGQRRSSASQLWERRRGGDFTRMPFVTLSARASASQGFIARTGQAHRILACRRPTTTSGLWRDGSSEETSGHTRRSATRSRRSIDTCEKRALPSYLLTKEQSPGALVAGQGLLKPIYIYHVLRAIEHLIAA